MSDKLQRAQHSRARHARFEGAHASAPRVGRRAGVDKSSRPDVAPGETGLIPVVGSHVGEDKTAQEEESHARRSIEAADALTSADDNPVDSDEELQGQVGTSAAIISICTIISRITGFARTWAMAFALGATFVSSSYQVANNLPNMLYELVMGGSSGHGVSPRVSLDQKKRGQSA